MDLIFWRHAEAEDWTEGCDDMQRCLTPRGEKQAKRVGAWLDRQLPDGTRVVCSPARRCEETVMALGRKYKLRPELAPDTTADALLDAAGWPQGRSTVLVVGHQPALGQSISLLLGFKQESCVVRKGAVWWIRTRERDGDTQTVIVTVQTPEML